MHPETEAPMLVPLRIPIDCQRLIVARGRNSEKQVLFRSDSFFGTKESLAGMFRGSQDANRTNVVLRRVAGEPPCRLLATFWVR